MEKDGWRIMRFHDVGGDAFKIIENFKFTTTIEVLKQEAEENGCNAICIRHD